MIVPFVIRLWISWGMASLLLLIILKGRCFISCECQISAIYIPQPPCASEWLLISVLLPRWMVVAAKVYSRKEESQDEQKWVLKTLWSATPNTSFKFCAEALRLRWVCLNKIHAMFYCRLFVFGLGLSSGFFPFLAWLHSLNFMVPTATNPRVELHPC